MAATIGIVVFPGTNCEMDTLEAIESLGGTACFFWHTEKDLRGVDAVVIPGGFAHGDYLRPGAIARFSPIMTAVKRFVEIGGPVIGICNGFQVLAESQLLPGALQKNSGLKFVCQPARLRVETTDSFLTNNAKLGMELTIPVNHFEGNFICEKGVLDQLIADDRIILRYIDNPNGSTDDIAAICNEARNVIGLMPHPERACSSLLGGEDGKVLFDSLLAAATHT